MCTYREADRETWRSTAVLLSPGVATEGRLRGSKVDVLIHTRWVIVRHPATPHKHKNNHPPVVVLIIGTVCVCVCASYVHRRRARGCHVGFGSGVGHLGVLDVGIFSLFQLIPLKKNETHQDKSAEGSRLYKTRSLRQLSGTCTCSSSSLFWAVSMYCCTAM